MDFEAGTASLAQEVEVLAKAERSRFTAECRLRILKEADACMKPGEIGALREVRARCLGKPQNA